MIQYNKIAHFLLLVMPARAMNKSSPIRLMLVDDHPVMRIGLANLLGLDPGFEVVAQADDGPSALELWRLHHPDICLMDVSMDGMDGVETLRRLRKAYPDARVLMLTSSKAPEDVRHAMDAGACGYVMKNIRRGELADAIRAAHRGELPAPRPASDGPQPASARRGLSHRELEVLGLIRQGFTNVEIGRLIGISERTTRWHVAAIMEKLGAADRAQAVARGFETGLLGVTGAGASTAT
jgi:DNA-binding NarL/FixJ family response regulator